MLPMAYYAVPMSGSAISASSARVLVASERPRPPPHRSPEVDCDGSSREANARTESCGFQGFRENLGPLSAKTKPDPNLFKRPVKRSAIPGSYRSRSERWSFSWSLGRPAINFEWQTDAPLARRAGVDQQTIDAIADGRRPQLLDRSAHIAADLALELMQRNGISDATYREAEGAYGQSGVVELTSLIGNFTMVCWNMNVARTPGPSGSAEPPLSAWPA